VKLNTNLKPVFNNRNPVLKNGINIPNYKFNSAQSKTLAMFRLTVSTGLNLSIIKLSIRVTHYIGKSFKCDADANNISSRKHI